MNEGGEYWADDARASRADAIAGQRSSERPNDEDSAVRRVKGRAAVSAELAGFSEQGRPHVGHPGVELR